MSEVQKRQKSSGSTLAGNLFPANCLLYLAKTRVLNKETRECTQLPKQMRVCAKCPPDSFVAIGLGENCISAPFDFFLYSYIKGLRTGAPSGLFCNRRQFPIVYFRDEKQRGEQELYFRLEAPAVPIQWVRFQICSIHSRPFEIG